MTNVSSFKRFSMAMLLTLTASLSFAAGGGGGGGGSKPGGDKGGSGTGGGNTDAIQFRNLARTSLMQAVRVSKDAAIVSAANKILEKVNSNDVNVVMKPQKLYYLGGEVDALNYPDENKIEVNEDRINKKLYVERLQLAIHEFAGLAKVPDVNNVISNELSNPAAFEMRCDVDISNATGKIVAHANMVPLDLTGATQKVEAIEYSAKVGGIYFMAIFDLDQFGRYKDVETNASENDQHSTYRNLTYGWAGRTWAVIDSLKYSGDVINIECRDGSLTDFPRQAVTPDFDNLLQK